MTKLAERAMLVHVKISQWSANKRDKSASAEVCAANQTKRGMARVNKSLLPPGALDAIEKVTSGTRAFIYDNTLPWMHDGPRILPNEQFMAVAAEMRARMPIFENAVRTLVEAYPDLKVKAKVLLGDLYDEADYPAQSEIAGRFDMDVVYQPLPDSADFRTAMVDDHMKAEWEKALQRVANDAMASLWQRLYDVAKHAADRLSNPDAIFRDTLVDNARELCALLPKLNIAGDPQLEAMRQEVERSLCNHNPDTLRKDSRVRSDAAAKLQATMNRMTGFFTPAS